MCHTSLPLPSPDRQAHTAGTTQAHNLSSISAPELSLAEVKTPGRRAGVHAGKRNAALIADASINSRQSQCVDRGAACPSIASVCVLHATEGKKKTRTQAGRAEPGWVVPSCHTNQSQSHAPLEIHQCETVDLSSRCLVWTSFRN